MTLPSRQNRPAFAVVGLGRIGRMHAANLAGRTPLATLACVVDVAQDIARRNGSELGVAWSSSFESVLADPALDAVVIATPTPQHAAMVEQAAAAGKHIFCEKPVALDVAATVRAIHAAAAAEVQFQVGFHRRFDPDWVAATSAIRSGELGEVRLFRTSLRDRRSPAPAYLVESGGFFVDCTIHDLDTARWMVGEIDEVTAFAGAPVDPAFAAVGDIDSAVVALRFSSGALGVIDNSRAAEYGYECSTEIVGSKGTVRIGDHRRTHVEWLAPGRASVDWVRDFTERFARAYLLELEAFAVSITDGRPPGVTGHDALAAFVLAQACERSLREGRTVSVGQIAASGPPFVERVEAAP